MERSKAAPRGASPALALGGHHVDDLAAAGDQVGEQAGGLVRQGPHLGLGGLREACDHGGIDGIGLGALPDGFGEVAHLRRVHHHHGQPGRRQSGGGHALEATGGLDGDQHRLEDAQLFAQLRQTLAVAPGDKRAALGKNRYVEPVLGNVDAYDPASHLHHHPSLPNRASLAAQATVRVRWNDGRGIALSYGLGGPRTRRSPLRHRVDQYTRSRRNRITRTEVGGSASMACADGWETGRPAIGLALDQCEYRRLVMIAW